MANPNWLPGVSGNPSGRPPSVFASQNDVADALLKKYTPSEIKAIAADPVLLDSECSSFQAIILIQLANALSARDNNDNALERERLLDRVVGRPIQRTEQKISLSIEAESALLEGRKRVARARGVEPPIEVSYSVVENPTVPDVEIRSELSPEERDAKRLAINAKARENRKGKLSFNQKMALRDKAIVDAVSESVEIATDATDGRDANDDATE